MELLNGEKIEPVGGGYSVVVNSVHTFGTDALLLSDFAGVRTGDRACDLGTGCGIIPLNWIKNGKGGRIDAVELQPSAFSLLEKTVELNNLEGRLFIHNADLRSLGGVLNREFYDVVTMNPPYKPLGTGIASVSDEEKIARHEFACTIEDLALCAKSILRYGGRLCLCHRPERLCDIFVTMRSNGLEPKKIRFVCQKEGASPWLVLIACRKGGKPGLTVEKNLIIQKENGEDTEELKAIFGSYREGGRHEGISS